jgi:DNA anti-recombination protein RmuC
MKISTRFVLLICLVCFLSVTSMAQRSASQAAEQSPGTPSADPIANELGLLRKSLQTLNSRLQVISDGLLSPDNKAETESKERLKRISTNFDLLTRAEERAEILRKQLIELIEKETQFKMRLAQLEEDMRPENIERSLSTYGTTRTVEIRETRRRVLENEKRGVESLLQITSQNRLRLEDDVRQADQLVTRLRQRLFPLIDKEIEKISPDR